MIDGVDDPYNFGSIVRSLYAFGVNGVIVRPRNWMNAATVVARASAGASELLSMAIGQTIMEVAGLCAQRGLTVFTLAPRIRVCLQHADLTVRFGPNARQRGSSLSLMGARLTRVNIAYGRETDISLGSAAAGAVIGYQGHAREVGSVHRLTAA